MKKSPLKWVGGKYRQKQIILDKLNIPNEPYVYLEPFLGSGEIFYSLPKPPERAYLADACLPLINFHETLQASSQELSEAFTNICESYPPYEEGIYAEVRALYNKIITDKDFKKYISPAKQSAIFLYLNKFGFNGLYRENGRGHFNVPKGSTCKDVQKSVRVAKNTAKAVSEFSFFKCQVKWFDSFVEAFLNFSDSLPVICYIDPPYYNTFTDYTSGWDNEESTRALINILQDITLAPGSRIVISNSLEALSLLEKGKWEIDHLYRSGTINSNIQDRGKVKELLAVRNF